ncbi:hypothetical protein [Methylobacterium oxalidis]|uniref:hypothetical protein n=1 Tax=Methylobacterium oxalidis TaxID=944322 RepID=UPI0011BEFAE8|nr:hypothetical protein [Methylobacterium oxalidis]GJE31583.1 hypothetical protein LDDCCGHA_1763 [Methylobacterium oxalidis]
MLKITRRAAKLAGKFVEIDDPVAAFIQIEMHHYTRHQLGRRCGAETDLITSMCICMEKLNQPSYWLPKTGLRILDTLANAALFIALI